MNYKNYIVITTENGITEKLRSEFNDFIETKDYYVIDKEQTAIILGREMCYEFTEISKDDIKEFVRLFLENIKFSLEYELEDYLSNNFEGKVID